MNLRAITRTISAVINPEKMATIKVNSGYTTTRSGDRVPMYTELYNIGAQVQALTEQDIQHANMLNVGGSTHVIYLSGQLDALVRRDNKGGDLIQVDNRIYLVTGVPEAWPDWCKVFVTLQLDVAL